MASIPLKKITAPLQFVSALNDDTAHCSYQHDLPEEFLNEAVRYGYNILISPTGITMAI